MQPSAHKGIRMYGLSPRKLIAIVVSVILVATIIGCKNSKEAHSTEATQTNTLTEVQTAHVALRNFQYAVQATGTLMAHRHTKVHALVAGQIESIPVDIGDRLERGTLLFKIREVDYELAHRQAEANLTRAEVIVKDRVREKNRMQNLFRAGSATQQARDHAITAYDEAEAALRQARVARDIAKQSLIDCTITGPYDCVVTARYLEKGEYAKKGNGVIEIMDLTILNAEMELPECYAGKINTGLPVAVSVTSRLDSVHGEIVAVNPKIDLTNRTFLIKVAVENRDRTLQPGLFCSALFHLPLEKNQMAIPIAALNSDEGRSTVWIVKDGKAFQKVVRTGGTLDGYVRILDGLHPGDAVITEGAGGLVEGVQVIVANHAS